MPDGDGLQLLRTVRDSSPSTAVIVLTAYGSVPQAVQAIHDGACDYLTKPISLEQLQSSVRRVMSWIPAAPLAIGSRAQTIIGNSPILLHALDRARQAAKTKADVLIEAESGTGKERLARFIHENSPRCEKPFVAVNCAAVPEHLLESELFGHVRGAFTGAIGKRAGKFELAEGGTLLLDEIGEMPISLQPKLLRALQEREIERLGDSRPTEVNIRIIATTNVSLRTMVDERRFRPDLYFRLNVIPLTLPALRDRREDIPALAEFFAHQFAAEAGRAAPVLGVDFISELQRHEWPGNVRELSNFMRRVVTLVDAQEIGLEHLAGELAPPAQSKTFRYLSHASAQPGKTMRELERHLLESTLEVTGGNRTRAAQMLGVSLRTIRNKIREYGLPPRSFV
jgi:DNA-binding NtrC family response regulator